MKTSEFIKESQISDDAHVMHVDHEIQMAREECYHSAANAIKLHKLLKQVSEQEGIDAWASEKITLANDYLRTVCEWLEYELMSKNEQVQPELPSTFDSESAEEMIARALGESSKSLVETAEGLNVGDDVVITGNVEFRGKTGVIDSFGRDNRFVVVNLYNHGRHSFHSSDVSVNDYADSDAEEARMYDSGAFDRSGVAEGSLNEYAVSGGGDDGNDSLFNYAKMWYNGNLKTQHQVEKALQKVGLDIGENEDENGGAYISDATGDYYESWTQEDLEQGVAEGSMYGDKPVSWEKGGTRAPTGAFRNPAAEKVAKDSEKIPNKTFKDSQRVDPRTGKKMVQKGVAEGINSIMDIVTPALHDNRSLDGYISSLYSYIEQNNMENDPKWKRAEQFAKDYHFDWAKKNGYPTANANPELARKGEKLRHRALINAVAKLFGQQVSEDTGAAGTSSVSIAAAPPQNLLGKKTIKRTKK